MFEDIRLQDERISGPYISFDFDKDFTIEGEFEVSDFAVLQNALVLLTMIAQYSALES